MESSFSCHFKQTGFYSKFHFQYHSHLKLVSCGMCVGLWSDQIHFKDITTGLCKLWSKRCGFRSLCLSGHVLYFFETMSEVRLRPQYFIIVSFQPSADRRGKWHGSTYLPKRKRSRDLRYELSQCLSTCNAYIDTFNSIFWSSSDLNSYLTWANNNFM
jgi:hypothetical protein